MIFPFRKCSIMRERIYTPFLRKDTKEIMMIKKVHTYAWEHKHEWGIKGCTVLSDIHADLLHTGCPVGLRWLDDFTSWPYVVEHKHGHRRETKHTKPGHSQHVGEEDKLSQKGQRIITTCQGASPGRTATAFLTWYRACGMHSVQSTVWPQ